jgi:hypothetical protein
MLGSAHDAMKHQGKWVQAPLQGNFMRSTHLMGVKLDASISETIALVRSKMECKKRTQKPRENSHRVLEPMRRSIIDY